MFLCLFVLNGFSKLPEGTVASSQGHVENIGVCAKIGEEVLFAQCKPRYLDIYSQFIFDAESMKTANALENLCQPQRWFQIY